MAPEGSERLYPQPHGKEYYRAAVGLWYTVWWRSEHDAAHPEYYRHWLEWSRLLPIRGRYSSGNTEKVDSDLEKFSRNHITYLILDDTNSHDNDNHSIADNITDIFNVADERHRARKATPAIAVALGGVFNSRPNDDEDYRRRLRRKDEEADVIERDYSGRPTYFHWKGKPLLISYGAADYWKWKAPAFTVRYGTGSVSHAYHLPNGIRLSETGVWAWIFNEPQPGPSEVEGVNPGYIYGTRNVKRGKGKHTLTREGGKLYARMWLRAIQKNPETIVIASWNDHAEETSVEAAMGLSREEFHSHFVGMTPEQRERNRNAFEKYEYAPEEDRYMWEDAYGNAAPFFYEEMTWGYTNLKYGMLDGYFYRRQSETQIYRFEDGALMVSSKEPAYHPVIVVPDDYFDWYYEGRPRILE